MTVKELITSSRSYRSFDPSTPISREQLVSFVDCARLSPSSRNLQPLKFRLVTEHSELDTMLSSTRWAGLLADMEIPPKGHAPTAYIVICLDTNIASTPAPFQRDVGITAQSILLAATEAGYGGCMIGSFSAEEVKKGLSLPTYLSPQLVLGMGNPDETVELVVLPNDGNIAYYRKDGVHYVPKRNLEELIV